MCDGVCRGSSTHIMEFLLLPRSYFSSRRSHAVRLSERQTSFPVSLVEIFILLFKILSLCYFFDVE